MGTPPARPTRALPFRPRFTIMLLWLVFFYFLFALLLGLPSLLEAVRTLPPGGHSASPEDLARAAAIMRRVLAGKLPLCLGASVVVVGLLSWRGALPGAGEAPRQAPRHPPR